MKQSWILHTLIFVYSHILGMQIVFSSIYATIIFFLTDQPLEFNRFARFTFVYVLVTIAADAFGLLLGAIANPIVSKTLNDLDENSHSKQ